MSELNVGGGMGVGMGMGVGIGDYKLLDFFKEKYLKPYFVNISWEGEF